MIREAPLVNACGGRNVASSHLQAHGFIYTAMQPDSPQFHYKQRSAFQGNMCQVKCNFKWSSYPYSLGQYVSKFLWLKTLPPGRFSWNTVKGTTDSRHFTLTVTESFLTHSTSWVQSRSFNKLWNLGQTLAWFWLAKGKKYRRTEVSFTKLSICRLDFPPVTGGPSLKIVVSYWE